MEKTVNGLACFDLDRTLISEVSGMALVATAWKTRMITLFDVLRAIGLYLKYKSGLADPLETINSMTGWLKGKTEKEMNDLCRITFNNVLYPSLFPEAREEILKHRSSDRKLIILSSAIDHICEEMSDTLGMDGCLCSSLESTDGHLTGRSSGRLCYGDEKLNRLTGYCKANGIKMQDVWFYSDSVSDLPVLLVAGNPVCVNPDRKLRIEARKRGWKILYWHS